MLFAACAQIQHTQVAELDARTVAQQTEMAFLIEESGMVLAVHGIGILLRAVLRDVVSLAGLADIAVEDHTAVDRDRNAVAHGVYLHRIPRPQIAEHDVFLRRDDAVDGAVLLVDAQVLVDRRVVVENLDFHAVIGGVHAHRRTDADAVVDAPAQEAEFEAQVEIAVLLDPQGIDGNLLTFENGDAIAKIVRLLYREKCRRFALYSNAGLSRSATRERKQGFLEGLKRCRLKARPELLCTGESSPEETERFFEQFRHAGKRPDAVCCLNDICAGDLIRDAHRRGIRLDGVRLSGFDHASLTAFLPHELLTVEPPLEELGKCAATNRAIK